MCYRISSAPTVSCLSLRDALPSWQRPPLVDRAGEERLGDPGELQHQRSPPSPATAADRVSDRNVGSRRSGDHRGRDRKSTRLNSSHVAISYAVFCLKKKKK